MRYETCPDTKNICGSYDSLNVNLTDLLVANQNYTFFSKVLKTINDEPENKLCYWQLNFDISSEYLANHANFVRFN